MQTLVSNIDNSVNFVEDQLKGFIESRYVRRTNDYFIAYLSSQTGCNRGCRFCHLTTTKQTQFDDVTPADFEKQINNCIEEYHNTSAENPTKFIHYNFMARGEPLNNKFIIYSYESLHSLMISKAAINSLYPKINISTIMPRDCPKSLVEMFGYYQPTIYYSIYSVNPDFRRKWLPNAMNVDDALEQLKEYQQLSKKIVKFHCAFIKGENDHPNDVVHMMEKIKEKNIVGQFNIVRYNPYSSEQGVETDHLDSVKRILSSYMPTKTITRVGEDVKASCGMFIDKKGLTSD